MKRILSLILAIPVLLHAQKKDPIYGKITAQILNPDYYTLQLPFLSVDFAKRNSAIFADMGADAKFGKLLASVKYRVNFADNLTENMQNVEVVKNSSVYEPQNSRNFQLGLGYVFSSRETMKDVSFYLKSSNSVRYYAVTKAPITRFQALNLGYTRGFTVVNGTGTKMAFSTLNGEEKALEPAPGQTETVMGYNYISVGYARGFYGWWRAEIKDFGTREAQGLSFVFANVLYMPTATLDDVAVLVADDFHSKLYQRMSLKESPFSRVGLNVGWQHIDFNGLGIYLKVEGGIYPGCRAIWVRALV